MVCSLLLTLPVQHLMLLCRHQVIAMQIILTIEKRHINQAIVFSNYSVLQTDHLDA